MDDARIVVVVGKQSIHSIEYDALRTFGRAIAHRGHILHTNKTKGACRAVVDGYEAEGKTPIYLTAIPAPDADVFVFSDAKYLKQLDEKLPEGWRDYGWSIIHNRKATTELARWTTEALVERGTPLLDNGTKEEENGAGDA